MENVPDVTRERRPRLANLNSEKSLFVTRCDMPVSPSIKEKKLTLILKDPRAIEIVEGIPKRDIGKRILEFR
jgi:hypothetical protein